MRLEGTLDAFSLADICSLLSTTKKTGGLFLRGHGELAGQVGVVYLREGAVVSARADLTRNTLAHRLVAGGSIGDDDLAAALAMLLTDSSTGLLATLLMVGSVDPASIGELATEQTLDALCELLRWSAGEFSFELGAVSSDDIGVCLAVDVVVAEGQRRLATWPALIALVPGLHAVVRLAGSPQTEPILTRDEWSLLACIDGWRTVQDIVELSGRGEYAVLSDLAALVDRELVAVTSESTDDAPARRRALFSQLERAVSAPAAPVEVVTAPATASAALSVARATEQAPVELTATVGHELLSRLMAGVRGL